MDIAIDETFMICCVWKVSCHQLMFHHFLPPWASRSTQHARPGIPSTCWSCPHLVGQLGRIWWVFMDLFLGKTLIWWTFFLWYISSISGQCRMRTFLYFNNYGVSVIWKWKVVWLEVANTLNLKEHTLKYLCAMKTNILRVGYWHPIICRNYITTILYYITSYHIISCYTICIWYHASYHVISCIVSYRIVSYRTISIISYNYIHYIIVYHGKSNDTVEFNIVFPPSVDFAKCISNASSKARESA